MEILANYPKELAFKNYVGRKWVTPIAERAYARRNPADNQDLIGYVPFTPQSDVDAAVAAASAAYPAWRATPAPRRGRLLLDVASLLEARAQAVAEIVTREEGKTHSESLSEVSLAIKVLEYMSGEGSRLAGETLPSEEPGRFAYTIREPLGVVGLITPWNFPLAVPLWKIAAALVCGNVVVWKPSRLTPLTSRVICELFSEVESPPGVLNLVNGGGRQTGEALVEHPVVRGISFTSSTEVGAVIYSKAARFFKKVQCEAGGKNAVIVLSDAALDSAADSIISGAFKYTGQRCTATSRVIVVDDVADDLVTLLRKRASELIVGHGMDPKTNMGPMADETQIERVCHAIRTGSQQAELLCGGKRLVDPPYDRGLFIRPTIFDFVDRDSHLAQAELFGPVLSVIRVSDFNAAISAANANRYGMVASVFSKDASSLFKAAAALECGIVHFNAPTIGAEVHLPFGGIKDTGVGDREMGSTAKNFYTELKVVYVNNAT